MTYILSEAILNSCLVIQKKKTLIILTKSLTSWLHKTHLMGCVDGRGDGKTGIAQSLAMFLGKIPCTTG